MVFYWLYNVFPFYAKDVMSDKTVGLLFLLSGLVIVVFQMPVIRLFQNVKHTITISIGNLLAAIGTALYLSVSYHWIALSFLAVFIATIGEIVYAPVYQTLSVKLFSTKNQVNALTILNSISH